GLGLTQYSDPIDPVTISASDPDSPNLTAVISRWKKSSVAIFTVGVPPSLVVTPLGGNTWKLEGNAFLAAGGYDVEITVTDDHMASVAHTVTIAVGVEDAAVVYDNPATVTVSSPGGTGNFTLNLNIKELIPD